VGSWAGKAPGGVGKGVGEVGGWDSDRFDDEGRRAERRDCRAEGGREGGSVCVGSEEGAGWEVDFRWRSSSS
jgi:hypothetical protein